MRSCGWVAVLLWLPLVGGAHAEAPDAELLKAKTAVKAAGVELTNAGLVRYFTQRTLSDAERASLPGVVERLGNDDFETREHAAAALLRAGRVALPALSKALADTDPERVRRAEHLLDEVTTQMKKQAGVSVAVLRLLEKDRPAEATPALLAYLPFAESDVVETAIIHTLRRLNAAEPSPVLIKALTDASPLRRAAAVHVVGRAGSVHRDAAKRLLDDSDGRVRFEAADALVGVGETTAVPALIALLADGPLSQGERAQETLFAIAGENFPAVPLSSGDRASRAKTAELWRAWWVKAGESVDLTKLDLDNPRRGVNVLCEVNFGKSGGRVWACRSDGVKLWQIDDVYGPADVQLLPDGRVLIADYLANRVVECDRNGEILWQKSFDVEVHVTTCRRLTNGNTFIATSAEVTEITPAGVAVYSHRNPLGGEFYRAQLRLNGHILFLCSNGKLIELDARGRVVRSISLPTGGWAGVDALPGDRFLVVLFNQKVVEIDAEGTVHWEYIVPDATSALRLPNGNTLISCLRDKTVREVTRTNKEVWRLKLEDEAFRAVRY